MVFHNTRAVERVERLEDDYEVGDVLWFKRSHSSTPLAVIKGRHGWHVSGLSSSFQWDRLLAFMEDSEVWAATEWSRVQ